MFLFGHSRGLEVLPERHRRAEDFIIEPFGECADGETAENQHECGLEVPDNDADSEQKPDKMGERFFPSQVHVQDVGIADSADH